LFTSIAQKVFGVIMNIPITEIFASVFRRGISSYEHIDLSVVLDSGPKKASGCTAVAWHCNAAQPVFQLTPAALVMPQ